MKEHIILRFVGKRLKFKMTRFGDAWFSLDRRVGKWEKLVIWNLQMSDKCGGVNITILQNYNMPLKCCEVGRKSCIKWKYSVFKLHSTTEIDGLSMTVNYLPTFLTVQGPLTSFLPSTEMTFSFCTKLESRSLPERTWTSRWLHISSLTHQLLTCRMSKPWWTQSTLFQVWFTNRSSVSAQYIL